MKALRVFIDFSADPDVMAFLRQGTLGHELVFPKNRTVSVLAQGEKDPLLQTADIAFGQPDPGAIADAPQLKWVQVSSSSITRYDTPEFRALAAARRLAVSNSASVYAEACAVHALSFILAQARKLPLGLETHVPNSDPAWQALRSSSGTLRGETVLILGYGAIGKRLTELLRPLGMSILAYRRKARGDEAIPVIAGRQLPGTLASADHIVNILPDSLETRQFFNAARFSQVKPGAVFYNIGRGATVDQTALLDALRFGRIQAAWLDVTDPEPLPANHPLWAQPNCFITPHVAGGHANEARTLVDHFLRNFQRFLQSKPLLDRVM